MKVIINGHIHKLGRFHDLAIHHISGEGVGFGIHAVGLLDLKAWIVVEIGRDVDVDPQAQGFVEVQRISEIANQDLKEIGAALGLDVGQKCFDVSQADVRTNEGVHVNLRKVSVLLNGRECLGLIRVRPRPTACVLSEEGLNPRPTNLPATKTGLFTLSST